MKGNKHKWWIKEGIKESRKHFKRMWNRKVRHAKFPYSNASYKKLAKDTIYIYCP